MLPARRPRQEVGRACMHCQCMRVCFVVVKNGEEISSRKINKNAPLSGLAPRAALLHAVASVVAAFCQAVLARGDDKRTIHPSKFRLSLTASNASLKLDLAVSV